MSNYQFVAVTIHNNSLGTVKGHSGYESALKDLTERAEIQLGRKLNQEEIAELNNSYKLSNEEDSDNIFCWSVSPVEFEQKNQDLPYNPGDGFNTESRFYLISPGTQFKTRGGVFYTKTGKYTASSNGDDGYRFDKEEIVYFQG